MATFQFKQTNSQLIVGLSSDTKPTTGLTAGDGYYFFETDTGKTSVYNQASNSWSIYITSGFPPVADGSSSSDLIEEANALYNGATFDRQRGNIDSVILASASRTTTQTSPNLINYNNRGIKVTTSVTVAGTGSITTSIVGVDANAVAYTILASAAIVANSTVILTVYPGLPVTTNVSANDILPRTYQVNVTANNANAVTYSVAASLIL